MSDEQNKPVETLRDGALKVSIFQNKGKVRDYFTYVPSRIFTDTQTGEIKETPNLSGSDPLRMANLLNKSYDRIAEFREQRKSQNRKPERER